MRIQLIMSFFLFGTFGSSMAQTETHVQEEITVGENRRAEFPGGVDSMMTFIAENLNYPSEMEKKRIEGKVVCTFIVEPDGSLWDVRILHSPHEMLSEETIRVVKLMPKWNPELAHGKVIRGKYTLPVIFKL